MFLWSGIIEVVLRGSNLPLSVYWSSWAGGEDDCILLLSLASTSATGDWGIISFALVLPSDNAADWGDSSGVSSPFSTCTGNFGNCRGDDGDVDPSVASDGYSKEHSSPLEMTLKPKLISLRWKVTYNMKIINGQY